MLITTLLLLHVIFAHTQAQDAAENLDRVIETTRGRQKLADEGYLYTFHKLLADGETKSWRCEARYSDSCKALIHTDAHNAVIYRKGGHTHGANEARVEALQAVTDIKQRAKDTMEQPSQIVNEATRQLHQAAMGQMPSRGATRQVIQRTRTQVAHAPPNPTSLSQLDIPERYRNYEATPGTEELFLLSDSGQDDTNRILIFGRESHSRWSGQMERVFMDGTFSITPPLFSQVFVIMAKRGEYVFPVIYALLPNKQQLTYSQLFTTLVNIWPDFSPASISLDFESALINAAQTKFPSAKIDGCLFHLMKNFRKHLSTAGLLQRYNTDSEFALRARMIPALAFVPVDKTAEAYETLNDELPPELDPILTWFEDNYIGTYTTLLTNKLQSKLLQASHEAGVVRDDHPYSQLVYGASTNASRATQTALIIMRKQHTDAYKQNSAQIIHPYGTSLILCAQSRKVETPSTKNMSRVNQRQKRGESIWKPMNALNA
jgi:hypothetical protein